MTGNLKSKIIRAIVVVIIPLYLFSCTTPTKVIESLKQDEFELASPNQVGLNPTSLARVDSLVSNQVYPNIHSVLISKDNKLVFEKYYRGNDQVWGDDIGVIDFNQDSLHDVRSVSKSVVSACIGIAIAQGKIRSVDQRVFDFFSEYKHLDTGMNSTLTIRHMLTMTTGQKWNENISYADTTNSERRMIRSKDPVEYALSQPFEKTPGTAWNYNGGTTQVLAAIIEKVTGKHIDAFAREFLFHPLDIARFEWTRFPNSVMPAAASGLRLRPRDMLKFGMLYINKGKYNNNHVLTADWVKESTRTHIPNKSQPGSIENGYGYQFWTETVQLPAGNIPFALAIGNGFQRIFIDDKNKMIVVITSGNYNARNLANNPDKLVYEEIYDALNQ